MHGMETTSTIETTIDRYLASWNESDGAARAAQSRDIWSADGRLVDPLIDAVGPDAIAAAIGELQDRMPGHSLIRTTRIDTHHDLARFGWTVNAPGGNVAVAGIDVVTVGADGRILTAIGFFGEPEVVA
jgi:SnoaL-like protein